MGPSIPHVLVVCCVMVVFSLPATCQATTYSGSGAGATSNVEGTGGGGAPGVSQSIHEASASARKAYCAHSANLIIRR